MQTLSIKKACLILSLVNGKIPYSTTNVLKEISSWYAVSKCLVCILFVYIN